MNMMRLLNALAERWSTVMLSALLEATLLLAIVSLVWLALRRWMSPQVAHCLFLLVLIKLALPIPVTLPNWWSACSPRRAIERLWLANNSNALANIHEPIVDRSRQSVIVPPIAINQSVPHPLVAAPALKPSPEQSQVPVSARVAQPIQAAISIRAWLMIAWASVVAILLVRFARIQIRTRRFFARAVEIDRQELPLGLRKIIDRDRSGSRVRWALSSEIAGSPVAGGLFKPTIVLPPDLALGVSDDQFTWILLHELAHVRRRDLWILFVQRVLDCVYFFHPAVWITNKAVEWTSECACDETALALGSISRRDGCLGFLAVVERLQANPYPLALGLLDSSTHIRRRVMNLLDQRREARSRLSPASIICIALIALALVPYARAIPRSDEPAVGKANAKAETQAATVLEIRVVEKATGKPMPGVSIPYRISSKPDRVEGATDPNGAFRIDLPKDLRSLAVWARIKGFVPLLIDWDDLSRYAAPISSIPKTFTFELEPAKSIGGFVRDAKGKVIAAATVRIYVGSDENRDKSRAQYSIFEESYTTDSEGHWTCDIVPSSINEGNLGVRVSHPDFLTDPNRVPLTPELVAQLRAGTSVLTLDQGLPVSVRVLDADGKPIKNAKVLQGASRFGTPEPPSGTTDSDGRVLFKSLAEGPLTLTINAKNFAPDIKDLNLTKNLAPLEVLFELQPGRTLKGRVVDSNGKPVAKAMAAVDTWRGKRSLNWRTETDAQGRFVWTDAPADAVLMDFGTNGFMYKRRVSLKASKDEYTITLDDPLRIHGTVIDAETGKPIDKFTVVEGSLAQDQEPQWQRYTAQEFFKGAYQLTFVESFPPVTIFRIEAEGYEPFASEVFAIESGKKTIDFRLQKTKNHKANAQNQDALSGIVVDPNGQPLADAEVILASPNLIPVIENGRLAADRKPQGLQVVRTKADGRYAFQPVPAREPLTILVLHDRGFARATKAELAGSSKIVLAPWGKVTGSLFIGDKKAGAKETVVLHGSLFTFPEYHQAGFSYATETDAQGNFGFDRLIPGEAKVCRMFSFKAVNFAGTFSLWSHEAPIEVAPGAETKVRIGGSGRGVVGKIVIPDANKNRKFAFSDAGGWLTPIDPVAPYPAESENWDAAAKQKWFENWLLTPQGRDYGRKINRFAFRIKADGTFQAEDVQPGKHTLVIQIGEVVDEKANPKAQTRAIGNLTRQVEIPIARPSEPRAFDLGDLEPAITQVPTPATPSFESR